MVTTNNHKYKLILHTNHDKSKLKDVEQYN